MALQPGQNTARQFSYVEKQRQGWSCNRLNIWLTYLDKLFGATLEQQGFLFWGGFFVVVVVFFKGNRVSVPLTCLVGSQNGLG